MGIQYLDKTWLDRRPAEEAWPSAATPADCAGLGYHTAAAATLFVALALMATPVLVASLAIVGLLK
jgi:hypothetical protein